MSSAWIKTRTVKSGEKRYLVYYRRGGRYSLQEYAGSFPSLTLARERKRLVDGELAAGRDPRLALEQLAAPRIPRLTLERRWNDFIGSRIDVGTSAAALYRNARDRFLPLLPKTPDAITPDHVQAAIVALVDPADDAPPLSPKTVGHYLSTLRQVLDHCEVEPNPARSKKIRLPAGDHAEPVPPSTGEWVKIKCAAKKRSLLPLQLIECGALRISEALQLTFGDVDFAGGRLRISRSRTKGRTAGQRWIPCPPALLDEIADRCPLEDRHPDRRVLDGLDDNAVRGDLRLACRDAAISHYHPHDLRHRRISLWFAHGFDPLTVKTWAGHAKASMSLDTYGHVLVSTDDEWRDFWLAAYDQARRPRALDDAERGARVQAPEADE